MTGNLGKRSSFLLRGIKREMGHHQGLAEQSGLCLKVRGGPCKVEFAHLTVAFD